MPAEKIYPILGRCRESIGPNELRQPFWPQRLVQRLPWLMLFDISRWRGRNTKNTPLSFTSRLKKGMFLGNYHSETYINTTDSNEVLTFHQTRVDEATVDIDTEDMKPVEIQLNDNLKAWFLDNPGHKVIFWDDGIYFFSVSGRLPKEDLVKTSNNVCKK